MVRASSEKSVLSEKGSVMKTERPIYYVALSGHFYEYKGVKYPVVPNKVNMPFFPPGLMAVLEKEGDDKGQSFYVTLQEILEKQHLAAGFSENESREKASDIVLRQIHENKGKPDGTQNVRI